MKDIGLLMLSDSFYPVRGGRELVIDKLMSEYQGKINAMLGVPHFARYDSFDDSSLPYYVKRCKSLSLTKSEVLAIPDRKFKREIEGKIKSGEINIIHVKTKYALMKYALKLKKKYGVKVVTTAHTNYPEVYSKTLKIPCIYRFALGRIKRILNKVDVVTTVSNYMREKLVAMGVKNKIEVIPNGNDFLTYNVTEEDIFEVKKKYSLNYDEPLLIYVGRISKEKSIDVIIKSLSMVKSGFKMVFVGGGDVKSYSSLAERFNLSKKCIFLGQINNLKELIAICSSALLQIFPSAVESFGLTIPECGAVGTPSIVTESCATSETIQDGVNGFITDGSAIEIAKKIDLVLSDKNLLSEVSKNVKKTFDTSWESVANQYIETYKSCLN